MYAMLLASGQAFSEASGERFYQHLREAPDVSAEGLRLLRDPFAALDVALALKCNTG